MTNGITREISFYAKSLTGLNQEVLVYWSTAKQIVTLTNDWQRFEISGTSDNSGAVLIGTRGGTTQYYAGGDANLDFAIWGLQVEDDGSGGGSSYATSYIPTSGSTVTRNQDIFTRDGIGSLINSTEGVLFVEVNPLHLSATNRYITIFDSSNVLNKIHIKFEANLNIQVRYYVNDVVSFTASYVQSDFTNIKIALKWKANDFALWISGNEEASQLSGTVNAASTFDTLSLAYTSGILNFNGEVKQLQVYDTALTDVQLASLTS